MTIIEYFDPTNIEHLRAYDVLQRTGSWPRSFWRDHIEKNMLVIPAGWSYGIASKLADAYVKEHVG